MKNFHNNLIKFNDRDVQNLNKRDLYVSVPLAKPDFLSTTTTTPKSRVTNQAGNILVSKLFFFALFNPSPR
jgi:hypothetical protein